MGGESLEPSIGNIALSRSIETIYDSEVDDDGRGLGIYGWSNDLGGTLDSPGSAIILSRPITSFDEIRLTMYYDEYKKSKSETVSVKDLIDMAAKEISNPYWSHHKPITIMVKETNTNLCVCVKWNGIYDNIQYCPWPAPHSIYSNEAEFITLGISDKNRMYGFKIEGIKYTYAENDINSAVIETLTMLNN